MIATNAHEENDVTKGIPKSSYIQHLSITMRQHAKPRFHLPHFKVKVLADCENTECCNSSGSTLFVIKNNLQRKIYNTTSKLKTVTLHYTIEHPKFIISNQKEESTNAVKPV